MTTGEKLYKLRKENGYTQESLSEIIGVTRQSISKWESDGAFPETEKLIQLSRLYRCSIDYLLREEIDLYIEQSSNKEQTISLSNFIKKNIFTFIWSAVIFGITLLFYIFPYLSKPLIIGIITVHSNINIYQILSSSVYEITNIVILSALFCQIFMFIIGTILIFSNNRYLYRFRIFLSIVESVIWICMLFYLCSKMEFQIGMIFMVLSSLGNLIGLIMIDINQYKE